MLEYTAYAIIKSLPLTKHKGPSWAQACDGGSQLAPTKAGTILSAIPLITYPFIFSNYNYCS